MPIGSLPIHVLSTSLNYFSTHLNGMFFFSLERAGCSRKSMVVKLFLCGIISIVVYLLILIDWVTAGTHHFHNCSHCWGLEGYKLLSRWTRYHRLLIPRTSQCRTASSFQDRWRPVHWLPMRNLKLEAPNVYRCDSLAPTKQSFIVSVLTYPAILFLIYLMIFLSARNEIMLKLITFAKWPPFDKV